MKNATLYSSDTRTKTFLIVSFREEFLPKPRTKKETAVP